MYHDTPEGRDRTWKLIEEFENRYRGDLEATKEGEERLRNLVAAGEKRSHCEVTVVRAPGRVNLIGEHTDYNDGFVLPIAIEMDVRFAVAPRPDRIVRLYSLDYGAETTFDLDAMERDAENAWGNYVRGMAVELSNAGYLLRGMDGVVSGNVPIGSGLSSSAAMEVAAGLALCAVSQQAVEPPRLAQLAQAAENNYMQVRCGIMDQFISRMGHPGHALLLDCRTLQNDLVPIPTGEYVFVVANSRKGRELADSAYNERRAQCEAAVAELATQQEGVTALRDVDPEMLERFAGRLDPVVYRRARHVVTENQRVLQAVEALRGGDLARFGALMNASHDSLRDDYEVSSVELDTLVEAAREVDGCLGSRLTGAGFGGCTVSLVRQAQVDAFQAHVGRRYLEQSQTQAEFYVTGAGAGAGLVAVE